MTTTAQTPCTERTDQAIPASQLPPLLRNFQHDSAQQNFNNILFRGRPRPTASEILSASKCENWTPEACDGVKLRCEDTEHGCGGLKRLQWERVTLRLSDPDDETQNQIALIVCRAGNEPGSQLEKSKVGMVMLHSTLTSSTCGRYLDYLADIANHGMVGIGMDARYHGSRSTGREYFEALIKARCGELKVRPFLYDTAADLVSVADYLLGSGTCDRLAITGVSLGGMHAWFAGACDSRWEVIVPMIGVQSFRYALENNMYHARVKSLQPLFDDCCECEGRELSAEVVKGVWDTICPGLVNGMDAVALALLCPRPTLILTGELDMRCPVDGVRRLVAEARAVAWSKHGADEHLQLKVYEGVGHQVNAEMWGDCLEFVRGVVDSRRG